MIDVRDVYSKITGRIVADLEQGVRPWMQPWSGEHAAGRITRPRRHNGGHQCRDAVVRLGGEGVCLPALADLQAGAGTRRQRAQGRTRSVGCLCQSHYPHRDRRPRRGDRTGNPFLKSYAVFNAEQCAGLPAQYTAKTEPPAQPPAARIERADRFFAATGVDIRHGGTRAFYAEGPDYVQMPPFATFRDAESHAATLAHELTHATKHEKRLARDMGRVRWGNEGYAKEELVAELGAAFLCADLEITPEVREDHAAYIGHWLKALQETSG